MCPSSAWLCRTRRSRCPASRRSPASSRSLRHCLEKPGFSETPGCFTPRHRLRSPASRPKPGFLRSTSLSLARVRRSAHQRDQPLGRRFGERRVVDMAVQLFQRRAAVFAAEPSNRACRACGSSNGWPARSIAETPRSGSRIAAGPVDAATLRPIWRPVRRSRRPWSASRSPSGCAGRTCGRGTYRAPSPAARS